MNWLRTAGLRIILSIGLGFALWAYVSYRVSPDIRPVFRDRPVTPRALSTSMVIVDQSGLPEPSLPPVTVTLEVENTTSLTPSDVQTYVNLEGLGPGDHRVPVNVDVPSLSRKPNIVNIDPAQLTIRIEQETDRVVPLQAQVTGQVEFSFEAGAPEATSQGKLITEVHVTGPASQVSRVTKAIVTADIDRRSAEYNSTRQVEPISVDGQKIDGVQVNPDSVNFKVPIRPRAGIKLVPVNPHIVGEPASGYIVGSVQVNPQLVRLTGDSTSLEAIQSVGTANVDVSNVRNVVTRTVSIDLPAGAVLLSGEPTTATITVQVQPISQPFTVKLPVPVQATNPPAGLLLSLSPQVVQVTLSGTAAQLSKIDGQSLLGTVNVSGRSAGTYQLAPTFTLPEGVSLVGSPPTVTVILRAPPSPIPTVAPTNLPTTAPTVETTAQPAAPIPSSGAQQAAPTSAPAASPTTGLPAPSPVPATTSGASRNPPISATSAPPTMTPK